MQGKMMRARRTGTGKRAENIQNKFGFFSFWSFLWHSTQM